MLVLSGVTDYAIVAGERVSLLSMVDIAVPVGRYAVLSPRPELRRPLVDVLCGARLPFEGDMLHQEAPSWPIARAGLVRGKLTGFQILAFLANIYGLDRIAAFHLAETLLSAPEQLELSIERWNVVARQEFGYITALLPTFGSYFVDGVLPAMNGSFARRWHVLFQQRLAGKSLFLSTTRPKEILDYCDRAIILLEGRLIIEDQLEKLLEQFPLRSLAADSERTSVATDDDLFPG